MTAREHGERLEWRSHFIGITARRMANVPKIGLPVAGALVEGALISRDPEALISRLGPRPDSCVACGESVDASDRLAASIEPRFESGLSFGMSVWVHRRCFEACEDTGEPRGFPW